MYKFVNKQDEIDFNNELCFYISNFLALSKKDREKAVKCDLKIFKLAKNMYIDNCYSSNCERNYYENIINRKNTLVYKYLTYLYENSLYIFTQQQQKLYTYQNSNL